MYPDQQTAAAMRFPKQKYFAVERASSGGYAAGVALAADEFGGGLAGLCILEAEFDSDDQMRDFAAPEFAMREVTDDVRFTGPYLAQHGCPVQGEKWP